MTGEQEIWAEVRALRDRHHASANEIAVIRGEMGAFDGLPESVTRLRVDVGRLKASMFIVGAVVSLLVPILTAVAVSLVGK